MIAGSIEIQLMAGIARLHKDMDQARGVVNKATSDMARAANAAKGALMSLGAGLSFTAIVAQVGGAQRRFDVLNSSLITATGSASNAAGAFKALSSFAASTPYGLAEVTQAFVKLRNMGMDPSEAALRSYGNTAAAMGKSLNQMVEAVADAATGEFERLKEFGIKAKQNGDQVALTFQGVSTTIGNNAREIEGYLQKLGDTEFAGGMDLRAKTLDGAISNLGDTWEATMLKFAQTGGGDLARESVIGITGALTDLTAILDAASVAADNEGNSVREMGLIHRGLTTIFEAVAVLGINVGYTFTQVGKELGGLAAQAASIMSGDLAGAKRIGEMMRAEAAQARKDVDARTAAILGASAKAQKAMATEADTRKKTGADALAQFRIEQAEAAKAVTAATEAARKKAAAAKAQADAQKIAAAADKLRLQQQKEIADAAAEAIKIQAEYAQRLGQSVADANREAEANEELARTFGMSKAAIEAETIARLEDRIERLRGIDMADDEIAAIELVIAAKKRSASAMSSVDTQAANKKATEDMAADYKRMAESVETSLTDALLRGFESGKGFGRNLIDTIKNMFGSLVLRPIISAIVNPVAGAVTGAMGFSGAAQAATSAGGSALGGIAGGLFGAGGLSGSLAAGAGWLTGATTLGGSLTAGASLVGTGTLAGGMAGAGMIVGALAPIALGIAAAVAIWKKLDTSGTYHAGGAASATGSSVSEVSASSLNMERIQTNGATQKMVGELASGVVKILDSTAQAFGKTAGYTAATAFADDTSKDGAWGSLVISKMGQSIVNWQDTRGNGKWSQKTFADGEAGQTQYLAALSASVRTALNSIGLPAWAQKMLDGLGGAPSMDEMAKVVEQINMTQRALKSMGEQLQGFASLSDSAVSALIAASGGIEALAGNASAYFENFYSDAEKSASTVKAIGEVLAGVGLSLPATRDEFRRLVEAQMALGESGAPAVAALLKVAGAFAQVNPLMEEIATAGRSAADVLSERIDLQKQLDQMIMTETQLLAKRRAELDPSNRLLFDQVQALQAAREAQDAAKTSMTGLIDRMKSFGDSARSLRDGLLTGSLSTLTLEQQYAEARRQRDTTLAAAMGGDTNAQSNLSAMQTAFLTISQQVNGGDARYSSDFADVLRISNDVANWTNGQIDTAQASLNVMNDQLAQLVQMNAIMQSLASAANVSPIPNIGVIDYGSMGAANTTALVNEVKALRTSNEALTNEVKALRSDQKQQTGDLIVSAEEISNREAEAVAKGVGAAINRGRDEYKNGVALS